MPSGPAPPAARGKCPRRDSNPRTRLRRPVLYPLSYEGDPAIVSRWPRASRGYDAEPPCSPKPSTGPSPTLWPPLPPVTCPTWVGWTSWWSAPATGSHGDWATNAALVAARRRPGAARGGRPDPGAPARDPAPGAGRGRRPGVRELHPRPSWYAEVLARAAQGGPGHARLSARAPASGSRSSSSPPTPPGRCTSATAAGRPSATRSPGVLEHAGLRRWSGSTTSTTRASRCRPSAARWRPRYRELLGEDGDVPRGRLPRRLHAGHRAASCAPSTATGAQAVPARGSGRARSAWSLARAMRDIEDDLQLASASTSTSGSPSEAALRRQRRGRGGHRAARRARATSTRRRARSGSAPPSSATTRTACWCAATARYTYFASDIAYHRDKFARGLRPRSSTSGAPTTTATCRA